MWDTDTLDIFLVSLWETEGFVSRVVLLVLIGVVKWDGWWVYV